MCPLLKPGNTPHQSMRGSEFHHLARPPMRTFSGNMDSELYLDILKKNMLPAARRMMPRGDWTLQHDGDPKHTSKLATNWIEENVPRLIPKEDWPPNSPDLNIADNVWSILQERVHHHHPSTVEELEKKLKLEWKKLDMGIINNMVDSMEKRLLAVRKSKGGSSGYLHATLLFAI